MTKIKKSDFIEMTYTGSVKEDGLIFDTTNETLAKDEGIYNKHAKYGPVVICVGKEQLISGLDDSLIGKDIDKEYEIELKPEGAFGKKDAKKIQLISTNKFMKDKIKPVPGLQVNIDGVFGIIKTVSGGRTLVDFNHPLAGKEVIYQIRIMRILTEDKEKIKSIISNTLNTKDIQVEINDGKARIICPAEIPKEFQSELKKEIKELIKEVKDIKFDVKKEQEKDKGSQQ